MVIKPILSDYVRSDGTRNILIYIYDSRDKSKYRVKTEFYVKSNEFSKGRVKNRSNADFINPSLTSLMDELERTWLSNRDLAPADLKVKKEIDLLGFFAKYIKMVEEGKVLNKRTKQPLGKGYAVKLESSRKLLQAFNDNVRRVDFRGINEKFHVDFVNYLRNNYVIGRGKNVKVVGMAENTISKTIIQIKTVMKYAMDKEKLHSNDEFKNFVAPQYESDQISLSPEEIEAILNVDTSKDPVLRSEQVRFEMAYNFFLRYNDSILINKDHVIFKSVGGVKKPFFKMVTNKTRKEVIIPIRASVYKALVDNGFKMASLNNSNSNENLKELGRLAGLTDNYTVTEFRRGKKIEKVYKKYQLIGTHTTRRAAATNYYLATKDLHGLMLLGGWTSFKQVLNYLRINKMDNALKASELKFFS